MAYMRGHHYVYVSGGDDGKSILNIDGHEIPLEVFDQLVVMRYAELRAGKVRDVTIDPGWTPEWLRQYEMAVAMENAGNFGADELLRKHGFPTGMDAVRLHARPPGESK